MDYNIDSYKVYLTGFSNGADFTYSMACYQSDLVTAIAPVSGLMPMDNSNECNPNHATSLMIFNGTNDDDSEDEPQGEVDLSSDEEQTETETEVEDEDV